MTPPPHTHTRTRVWCPPLSPLTLPPLRQTADDAAATCREEGEGCPSGEAGSAPAGGGEGGSDLHQRQAKGGARDGARKVGRVYGSREGYEGFAGICVFFFLTKRKGSSLLRCAALSLVAMCSNVRSLCLLPAQCVRGLRAWCCVPLLVY